MEAAHERRGIAREKHNRIDRDEEHLVIFTLGDEHYGVDIGDVWEINTMQSITRIPQAPHFIEGVINLRGEIVPVMDLRKRLDLPATAQDRESRIMVIRATDGRLGLIVDSVREVLKIPSSIIEPASELSALIEDGYLRGIAKQDGYLVILLDLHLLLQESEHQVVDGLPSP